MKLFSQLLTLTAFAVNTLQAQADPTVVNQRSSNITVLRTFPTGINIAFRGQLSWNAVVLDPDLCQIPNNNGSNFEEETVSVDCTDALNKALREQMPQLAAPIAGRFIVPATTEPDHSTEPATEHIVVKNFSCALQEIQTASRESALYSATGIGFFFADTLTTIPSTELLSPSPAVSQSGEKLAIHRFVTATFCTSGTRSAALRATYSFRPYMEFTGNGQVIYRTWDAVSGDYVISESSVRAFDRSSQVLQ